MKKVLSIENLKEIGQRIKDLRKKLGLSKAEFAKKYNLKSVSSLSKYENGLTEPPVAFFLKLSKDAGVSVDWILTGEKHKDRDKVSESKVGKIFVEQGTQEIDNYEALIKDVRYLKKTTEKMVLQLNHISKFVEHLMQVSGRSLEKKEEVSPLLLKEYRARYQPGTGLIIITPKELKTRLKQIKYQEQYVPLPLLSENIITEDFIIIDNRDVEAYIITPKIWLRHGHVYCCVRIRDDSMFPILEEGFVVAIDCSVAEPSHLKGKIIAAHDKNNGHRITIKKLWLTERYYILQPFNMIDYQPTKIPIEEKNIIIGEVAWWWVCEKD